MKKIIIILIPLLPFIVKAQLLNTVEQIATYNNPYSQLVFVKDTLRGGEFMPYSGSNPADNGLIFQDALGRKWKRSVSVDYINISWFGAKTDGSDCRAIIIAAINSAKVNLPTVKIRIPGTGQNEYYKVSDSIELDSYVEIFGDGHESKVQFYQHKKGLVFTNPGTHYSVLRDITITAVSSSASPKNTWDSSKHGIIIKSPVHFVNVWVSNFDGCGFYMVNSLNATPPGNTNTSTFTQCHSYYNLLHGFYIKGADANAMSFNNCDVVGNGAAGFNDRSFLGNHYSDNHTATNGSPELTTQRGLVKFGGTVYACIKDTTIGVSPPNTTYWQDVGTEWIGFENVLDYNPNTVYWSVGGYIAEGGNQYGTFNGNYCELDQAPGYIDYGNTGFGNKMPTRNIYSNFSSELGRMTSNSLLSSAIGIASRWFYGGNIEGTIDPSVNYSTSSGFIAGSSDKAAIVDFWYNGTKVGDITTSTTTKLKIQSDTINIVGKLLNNGSEIAGGSGISQSTLNDSTSALRVAIDGKQPAGNYASGVTNTGDNATNTQYSGLAASKQDVLVSGTNIKTINGTTLLGSGNMVISGGGLGYTLSVQALTSSPADAQTIYFGQLPKAPTTTANISKVYIRKAGTIKMAQIYTYSGTAGTGEAWVMNIRLNNTTDTQIASVASATNERIFTNSSLNIAVNAGDYIEIKCVNPTWATNPLTFIAGGYIYIE